MKLYSTLDKKIVELKPLDEGVMSMYNCGPTVYYRMHLGNIRAYVNWDVLHRSLLYLGYDVHRVMNLTDVGHMTEDEDFGEDKLQKQAGKEGVEPIDVANKYIRTVLEDFSELNILAPNGEEVNPEWNLNELENYGWTRATDYIQEMINVVKDIEKNGYAYETDQAVYFDVTKLDDYTIFTGQKLEDKQVAVRKDVDVDPEKRNPADFVLWMKRTGKYANHAMYWGSPWGEGFPGWHVECTAMSTDKLGEYFDIHTGGIDHIPVHHANERAQNIGAFNHPVVKYWVHNEWLVNMDESKMSKSDGGADDLSSIVASGFDPLDLRYLFISVNYRTKLKFSREALEGARNARVSLVSKVKALGIEEGDMIIEYVEKFKEVLENNLNMSDALALANDLLKSEYSDADKLITILDMDSVFGLDLDKVNVEENIPEEVMKLGEERKIAREEKNFEESDRLRDEIMNLGYTVLDTAEGQKLERK